MCALSAKASGADKDKVVWAVGGWATNLDEKSRLLVVVVDH